MHDARLNLLVHHCSDYNGALSIVEDMSLLLFFLGYIVGIVVITVQVESFIHNTTH